MRWVAALFAVWALLPAQALAATARTTLPDVEDEVMCVTCGTALNISQAPSADAERTFIRNRIREGDTKNEIKRKLVSQYGPKVLAEPHQRTSWLVPVILAVFALLAVALTVRRWRRLSELDTTATPALAVDARDRLDRDMRTYDL